MARENSTLALGNRFTDSARYNGNADWYVPACETLGHSGDISLYSVVSERPPGAATPCSTHHLIGNQHNIVAIADRPNRRGVSRRSGNDSTCSTHNRLEDESGHALGAN